MDVCAYFVGRRAYIKKHLERYLKYENVRVRYERALSEIRICGQERAKSQKKNQQLSFAKRNERAQMESQVYIYIT